MAEHEPLVRSYVHLDKEPRAGEALHTLRKVASLVKPIMRARGWTVGQLAEFYPSDPNLLGLNVNGGSKICLRLRHAGDRSQFMPMESVTDTMLHELCHIVHGAHNERFHALWDQLRDELQGLMMKGYTGEGFLSRGRRLGGARMPEHEARRLAREAAERRRRQQASAAAAAAARGRRLGGASPLPGQDMRNVIAGAAQRRSRVLRGCATERLSDREMQDVADTATRNGFRTQADEDEANEVAIAQALWELVQEEERRRPGGAYVAPCAGGSAPGTQAATGTTADGRTAATAMGGGSSGGAGETSVGPSWNCAVCTLQNPEQYLCCDACGVERPPLVGTGPRPATRAAAASAGTAAMVDLTRSPPARPRGNGPGRAPAPRRDEAAPRSPPPTWSCSLCWRVMERQWWTCATCGRMKDSS